MDTICSQCGRDQYLESDIERRQRRFIKELAKLAAYLEDSAQFHFERSKDHEQKDWYRGYTLGLADALAYSGKHIIKHKEWDGL